MRRRRLVIISSAIALGIAVFSAATISRQSPNAPVSASSSAATKVTDKPTSDQIGSDALAQETAPTQSVATQQNPVVTPEPAAAQTKSPTPAKTTTPTPAATNKSSTTAPPLGSWKQTYSGPIQMKTATLTNLGEDPNTGSITWRYEYTFTEGTAGVIRAELQHEVVEGTPTYANYGLRWAPLDNYALREGNVSAIYDVMKGSLYAEDWGSYRVRIHVTSPNEVYSNWMIVE